MTQSTAPDPSTPAGRVLLAEDEALFHTVLGEFLQLRGYEVLHAMDGEEAVRVAREQRPDLILMDIMMPRMTGTEAVRALKEDHETAHIPVIAVTAATYGRTPESTAREGFDGYVPKPFTAAQIAEAVRSFIGPGRGA
ncbi:MAG TPA: response regulator [Longimicrobiaceae bacterium]|nr:response regulator [Longimicrobiaceae bacterium]